MRRKLLFVCSRNQWRSPTAEALLRGNCQYEARSAGTSDSARVRVNEGHVRWADHILVMEPRHRAQLQRRFGRALEGKILTVLDIQDDYSYMDADLIGLLQVKLQELFPGLEWSQ